MKMESMGDMLPSVDMEESQKKQQETTLGRQGVVYAFSDLGKLFPNIDSSKEGSDAESQTTPENLDSANNPEQAVAESTETAEYKSAYLKRVADMYRQENLAVFVGSDGKYKPIDVVMLEIKSILADKEIPKEVALNINSTRNNIVRLKKDRLTLIRDSKNETNIDTIFNKYGDESSVGVKKIRRVVENKIRDEYTNLLHWAAVAVNHKPTSNIHRKRESKPNNPKATVGEVAEKSQDQVESSNPLVTENEITDDYFPKNLPIAREEIFAGDLAEDVVKQPESYVSRNNAEENIGLNQYSVFSGDLAEDVVKQPEISYVSRPNNPVDKTISLDLDIHDEEIKDFVRRRNVDENGNTVLIEQSNLSNLTEDKDIAVETKEKSEWRKAKEVYTNSEKEYNAALEQYHKNYYSDQSWKGKLSRGLNSTKKFFGLNPELPLNEDLNLKKFNYRQSRAEYLESLNKALKNRAGKIYEGKGKNGVDLVNKEDYTIESEVNGDRNKRLFAKKFILDPNQERLDKQKELMTPEQQSRLASMMSKVMGTMAKNKVPIRIGMVTMAAITGAATGGLSVAIASAGAKLSSIVLGSSAGIASGKIAGSLGDKWIQYVKNKAEEKINNFSLRHLNDIEDDLIRSYDAVDRGEKIKKGASILAAIGAGYETASYNSELWSGATENLSEEPVRPTVDHTAQAVEELSKGNSGQNHNVPNYSDESVGREEVSPVENEVPENHIQELQPDKYVVRDSLGNPSHVLTLSGISFDGDGFKIPDSELKNVENEIARIAAEIISENPNISTEELEKSVSLEIQNKFIGSEWWNNTANVFPKVKIGEWYYASASEDVLGVNDTVDNASGIVGEPNDRPDGGENYPVEAGYNIVEYRVEPGGENLRTIVEKVFPEKLDGLDEYQKVAVMDRLMGYVRHDELLRNSLALEGDVSEPIKEGTLLDLALVGNEFEHLSSLMREAALENDASIPSRGELPVTPVGVEAEVSNIPIKVASPELDANYYPEGNTRDSVAEFIGNRNESILNNDNETTLDIVSTEIKPPQPPLFSSENYFDSREYQQFVEQKFGGTEKFNQILNRTVENFDNSTYDYFDKSAIFGKDYQSPYTLLSEKTMAEIAELSAKNPDEIKATLGENIKYETYLAWKDRIDEIIEKTPADEGTTLKDLYSRYVAEKLDGKGNLIKPKS